LHAQGGVVPVHHERQVSPVRDGLEQVADDLVGRVHLRPPLLDLVHHAARAVEDDHEILHVSDLDPLPLQRRHQFGRRLRLHHLFLLLLAQHEGDVAAGQDVGLGVPAFTCRSSSSNVTTVGVSVRVRGQV